MRCHAQVRESDPMVIMFTSGSSGPPKGTVHSHRNALGAVRSGLQARRITADSRLYLPMPFFWVGGFGAGILSALVAGATLVTEPVPNPDSTLELLQREQVTLFRGLARAGRGAGPPRRDRRLELIATRKPGGAVAGRDAVTARGAGVVVGNDRIIRPLLRISAPIPTCRNRRGAAAAEPFDGMDVRIVDDRYRRCGCPAAKSG